MLKVGVTGGIGSGKSMVCKLFVLLGVPLFEADRTAKQLMNDHPEIREKLIHLFGPGIYLPDHLLDRKKLAGFIFNDRNLLLKVNEIVHPLVRESFQKWLENQFAPYIIHEAAILFESGFYRMMDYNILVSAPEEDRIKRVIERDKISEVQVRDRIKHHWNDERKSKLSDYIIINDDNHLIIPQVLEIDEKLKKDGKIR